MTTRSYFFAVTKKVQILKAAEINITGKTAKKSDMIYRKMKMSKGSRQFISRLGRKKRDALYCSELNCPPI